MLCFRYKKLLMPYVENALDERTRNRVSLHINRCSRCAAELRVLESMSQALQAVDIPAADPATDLWAKVSARIAEESARTNNRFGNKFPKQRSIAAVGFAAAFIIVVVIIHPVIQVDTPQIERSKYHALDSKRADAPKATLVKEPIADAKPYAPKIIADVRKVKALKQRPILMAKLPQPENKPDYSDIKSDTVSDYKQNSDEEIKGRHRGIVGNGFSAVTPRPRADQQPLSESMSPSAPASSARFGFSASISDNSPAIKGNVQAVAADCAAEKVAYTENTEFQRNQLAQYKLNSDFSGTVRLASRLIRSDSKNAIYYYTDLGFAYARLGNASRSERMYQYALDYGNSETWPVTAVSIKNASMLSSLKGQYAERYKAKNEPIIGKILLELQSVEDDKSGVKNK